MPSLACPSSCPVPVAARTLSIPCSCMRSRIASPLCFWVQGCTNVLWGLARQDAKRMQLITGKGHLFKVMAWRLVQQAERLLPNEGLPVNFSMLIWSLGTLNYHPGMPPRSSCFNAHPLAACLFAFSASLEPRVKMVLGVWRLT